jgi:sec-independent protein translocase protein TatC
MSKTRSYAIVAIFVAAAILTPTPDMLTMTLMAAPMIVLYEICIWLAYFDRKKSRLKQEQEDREEAERRLQREEKRHAAEAAEQAEAQAWHDAKHHGDDGWHADFPELDHPASDSLTPQDDLPEEGERRRIDP